MAEFLDPFRGVVPNRKLTLRELTRAVRQSLSAEEEATHLYEAIADATDNELAQKVMQDIANEERVHAGEFQRLLSLLLPDEDALMQQGADEVNEMAQGNGKETSAQGSASSESAKTVGSLKA